MWFLIVLLMIFGVSAAHFVIFCYDFYSAGAIQEQFTPEKIQEMMESDLANAARLEGNAKGGVNQSAAKRIKELDKIVGESLVQQADPVLQALAGQIPGLQEWFERNPDLAQIAFKKLEPAIKNIMGGLTQEGNSGQGRSGGWR
jgi:hypothetical protein